MRLTAIVALLGISLLPLAAFAQTAPQTAAIESPAPAASAPAVASRATGGITRDQFIERAKERAAQRAAARFDQMDSDHDGVVDRTELRAWRGQHSRRAAAPQPAQPAAQ